MTEVTITCPRCGRTSYNPNDVRALYCGFCSWWTSDPQLGAPDVIVQLEREGKLPRLDA